MHDLLVRSLGSKDGRKGGGKGHCFVFLQSGVCPREQCPFLHLTQKEMDDKKKGSSTSAAVVCIDEGQECITLDASTCTDTE